MQKGTIVELGEKESGFIKRAGVNDNLFFHGDNLVEVTFKNLRVGDTLSFNVRETNKGPYAIDIERVATKKVNSLAK
jgi:cold shock CspA family protein